MVLEWVQKYHSHALQWRRVRVGPLPKTENSSFFSVLRRWADLVFVEDDIVYIVEAKVRPDPGALSQLKLYERLFPQTPEFSQLSNKQIKLVFLTSMEDKEVKKLAAELGIEYEVYRPAWLDAYIKEVIKKTTA